MPILNLALLQRIKGNNTPTVLTITGVRLHNTRSAARREPSLIKEAFAQNNSSSVLRLMHLSANDIETILKGIGGNNLDRLELEGISDAAATKVIEIFRQDVLNSALRNPFLRTIKVLSLDNVSATVAGILTSKVDATNVETLMVNRLTVEAAETVHNNLINSQMVTTLILGEHTSPEAAVALLHQLKNSQVMNLALDSVSLATAQAVCDNLNSADISKLYFINMPAEVGVGLGNFVNRIEPTIQTIRVPSIEDIGSEDEDETNSLGESSGTEDDENAPSPPPPKRARLS